MNPEDFEKHHPSLKGKPVTFLMKRGADESGVSGTGIVLEGTIYSDGTCTVRWLTAGGSTAVYESFERFRKIHVDSHPNNNTEFVFPVARTQTDNAIIEHAIEMMESGHYGIEGETPIQTLRKYLGLPLDVPRVVRVDELKKAMQFVIMHGLKMCNACMECNDICPDCMRRQILERIEKGELE